MEFRIAGSRISINVNDPRSLAARVRGRFAAGEGFAMATVNLDHLVKLQTDTAFRLAYGAHDLVVADGNPIVWLSRLAGQPVRLVPGSDILMPLCHVAAAEDAPVALVGSTPETLEKAGDALEARVPGLRIVARIAPPMGFDPTGDAADVLLDELAASGARFCLIALGAPKQEILAARGRARLPDVGFASIGAGLDFLAGHQRRAPRWMRALALEWAWRMFSSPRRLALRYARCVVLLPRLAASALNQRRMRGSLDGAGGALPR